MRSFKHPGRLPLTLAAPLFLLACSQVGFETFGCGCAGRSYAPGEVAQYRAAAAKGDQVAIAEMQTYHGWREEPREAMRYFEMRIPALSTENAGEMSASGATFVEDQSIPHGDRRAMLRKLRIAMKKLYTQPRLVRDMLYVQAIDVERNGLAKDSVEATVGLDMLDERLTKEMKR